MDVPPSADRVKAWSFQGLLLEWYDYAPGPANHFPKHAHEEYQFCVGLDTDCEYDYRGSRHLVPRGSLSVIHPGEVHAARGLGFRPALARFRVLYVPPAQLQQAAVDVAGRPLDLPHFALPVLPDQELAASFLRLHAVLESAAPLLEKETRFLQTLAKVIARGDPDVKRRERLQEAPNAAIRRAQNYLHDNFAQNVSLDELAGVAGLSAFHLCRVFRQQTGLPPHAYQVALRITRAKTLLASGVPAGRTASDTGFSHQSHFGWHFKRLVGVTPGVYAGGYPTSAAKS